MPTYFSLQVISAAGSGGGGRSSGWTQESEGQRGGGSGAGGRDRDGGRETRSEVGVARRKTAATENMAATESRRKRATEYPPVGNSHDGARGKYCMVGKG